MARTLEVEAVGAAAIVVRRATGPADVDHLRATGERLGAAAHPGVAEIVSSQGGDDEWELRLVHAGRPVDVVGRLSAEQVAAIAAAVAATLADLHAIASCTVTSTHRTCSLAPMGGPCSAGSALAHARVRDRRTM